MAKWILQCIVGEFTKGGPVAEGNAERSPSFFIIWAPEPIPHTACRLFSTNRPRKNTFFWEIRVTFSESEQILIDADDRAPDNRMITEEKINLIAQQFENHYGIVMGIARRYAPNESVVDDIVQQVFLELLETFEEKWDAGRDIGPLLAQMAKRKAQLAWRNQNREMKSVERIAARLLTVYEENETQAENEATYTTELLALKHCLAKLPAKSREMVEEHYFHGIPMNTMADEKQIKQGTIRRFFHRVRLGLRHCLEKTVHFIAQSR